MSVNVYNKVTGKLIQIAGNANGVIDDANVSNKTTYSSSKIEELTSNAELTDARIGANGITYDNLGESIRSQFSGINTYQKINFKMGLPDGTSIGIRASSELIFLK